MFDVHRFLHLVGRKFASVLYPMSDDEGNSGETPARENMARTELTLPGFVNITIKWIVMMGIVLAGTAFGLLLSLLKGVL